MSDNKKRFIDLLKSTKREGIDKLIDFLEKTDFFTAPASTRFHSSYEGGLLQHSLNVYDCLLDLALASDARSGKGSGFLRGRNEDRHGTEGIHHHRGVAPRSLQDQLLRH